MPFYRPGAALFGGQPAVESSETEYRFLPNVSLGENPYSYVDQSPIALVDLDGHRPGDPFKNIYDAVEDFCETYAKDTLSGGPEYATGVYPVCIPLRGGWLCYFTYRKPQENDRKRDAIYNGAPEDVAACHTHPLDAPNPTNPDDYTNCNHRLCAICRGLTPKFYSPLGPN